VIQDKVVHLEDERSLPIHAPEFQLIVIPSINILEANIAWVEVPKHLHKLQISHTLEKTHSGTNSLLGSE
jgi:hypothetical protein